MGTEKDHNRNRIVRPMFPDPHRNQIIPFFALWDIVSEAVELLFHSKFNPEKPIQFRSNEELNLI